MITPTVFGFVQPKGGVGKTVTSNCLAGSETFAKHFKKIALVEFDPQGNQWAWTQQRQKGGRPAGNVHWEGVFDRDVTEVTEKLKHLAKRYDCLILDPPSENFDKFANRTCLAVTAALGGVTLIPMSDAVTEETAYENSLRDLLLPYMAPDNKVWIVPTRFPCRAKIDSVTAYFDGLRNRPPELRCLPAFVPRLNVFERYMDDGQRPQEYIATLSRKKEREAAQGGLDAIENIARLLIDISRN